MASNCRSRTSETLTLDAEPHPSNGDYSSISVSLIIDCTGCAISSDLSTSTIRVLAQNATERAHPGAARRVEWNGVAPAGTYPFHSLSRPRNI